MRIRLYQLGIVSLSVVALLLFTNCPGQTGTALAGKVTGGGTVATDGGKANFAFVASSCDGLENVMGRFNFNDKSATQYDGGVMMKGAVEQVGLCDPEGPACSVTDIPGETCPAGSYMIQVMYRNKNPKLKDEPDQTGDVVLCVEDTGEGTEPHGRLVKMIVGDGPYDGYELEDKTVQGNIQAHACPVE